MAVWLTVPATWVGRAAINLIRAVRSPNAGGLSGLKTVQPAASLSYAIGYRRSRGSSLITTIILKLLAAIVVSPIASSMA